MTQCAGLGISLNTDSASTLQVNNIYEVVSYIIVIFIYFLKASLNHYKGFTDDDECTQLERMVLVSFCSKIMNVRVTIDKLPYLLSDCSNPLCWYGKDVIHFTMCISDL